MQKPSFKKAQNLDVQSTIVAGQVDWFSHLYPYSHTRGVSCLFEQIWKFPFSFLVYFSLYLVIIDFHKLVWSRGIRNQQENSILFLFSGLKQSLKMSSQILSV